ncbi:DUF805 domain-containing protein [Sulfitobacter sp.]|uniref:DUF805 domain-containing protein n=1 Tax=Sulfitobacter sp. TaxID=1903071 RepID=UPI003003614F
MTGPFTALTQAFVNIFNFSGRSTRSEFWWPYGAIIIASITAGVFDAMMVARVIQEQGDLGLFSLGAADFSSMYVGVITLIPLLSLSVRRLHDAGFSGFWILLNFIPVIGGLVLLVLYVLPSNTSSSIYGAAKQTARVSTTGAPVAQDAHKRAMQGYALLYEKDKPVTPAQQAARKAEITDYYRSHVLKPAASI